MPHIVSPPTAEILFYLELKNLAVPVVLTSNYDNLTTEQKITIDSNTLRRDYAVNIEKPAIIIAALQILNDPLLDKISFDSVVLHNMGNIKYDVVALMNQIALPAMFLPFQSYTLRLVPGTRPARVSVLHILDIVEADVLQLITRLYEHNMPDDIEHAINYNRGRLTDNIISRRHIMHR